MIDAEEEARLTAALTGSRAARAAALGELFELTHRRLLDLSLRVTGRGDLAQDAVQEAFVDVLRGVEGFRGEARLSTWLYRIALRAALRVAARAHGRAGPLPDEVASEGGEPHEELARREGAARVLDALSRLPAAQRAALALAAVDRLSRTEIAEVLGVPVGTVDSRLHQAREGLRTVLARGERGRA